MRAWTADGQTSDFLPDINKSSYLLWARKNKLKEKQLKKTFFLDKFCGNANICQCGDDKTNVKPEKLVSETLRLFLSTAVIV